MAISLGSKRRDIRRLIGCAVVLCVVLLMILVARFGSADAERARSLKKKAFDHPTNSSPIALSADNRLVWVVNPGDDSVSVIRTDNNTLIAKIEAGDEPQEVALDPANRFAYVANPKANGITVIRIKNSNPDHFKAEVDKSVGKDGHFITGAEPWNIVTSPDGKRVFVANSAQDTITVIKVRKANKKHDDDDRDEEDRAEESRESGESDEADESRDSEDSEESDEDENEHHDRHEAKGKIRIIGSISLRRSLCNDPDRSRRFQPRGLAVTEDNSNLYVTRFLSFTKPDGKQGDDNGREGLVCRVKIDTNSKKIEDYVPVGVTTLKSQITGFKVDSNGDGIPDDTSAFPNQLQSIVIRGDHAYLPNIAASPQGPQLFNVTTMAFVNRIDGVTGAAQTDAGALNLHLGARNPEPGKIILFFANPWAIAFTNQSGVGAGYAVSAGSDLLVKVNVAANGALSFTVDDDTTRYIDLNDPDNPKTAGSNAGKNPQGIVITDDGATAYVTNFVSRNVSVVDLNTDSVTKTIKTVDLPAPGSQAEVVAVGAEMFFSSRGNFDKPEGATISTRNRLSQVGWQACASCHFKGWTDGVVWQFGTGARKSVPLNASFNPHTHDQQRILNYSAIFDEVEDFEGNIRNTSGPGPLATPTPCDGGPQTSTFDPNHGLLLGINDVNTPPCVIAQFIPPNANRRQLTVTLPGSNTAVPALTALREWVKFAIRTPNGRLTDKEVPAGIPDHLVTEGRELFIAAGCATCHGGQQWTSSIKDFISPPNPADIFTEVIPPPLFGNPVPNQYLNRFLRDIQSFNLGNPGKGGRPRDGNVGADEIASIAGVVVPLRDGLGIDYNGDGKGNGFSPPSLLGIGVLPPYYHNGACESLRCVLRDAVHRAAGLQPPHDILGPDEQLRVMRFLETIDAETQPIGP